MVIMKAGSRPISAVSGQAGISSAMAAREVSRSKRSVPAPIAWYARLRADGGRIVMLGHGHFSRILAVRWMDLPVEDARHLMLTTASLSIVGYEHTLADPAIVLWNDDHHMKPGG